MASVNCTCDDAQRANKLKDDINLFQGHGLDRMGAFRNSRRGAESDTRGARTRAGSMLLSWLRPARPTLHFAFRPSGSLLTSHQSPVTLLYLFSAGGEAGRSEFQVSVPHFHFPSAFFSQTSTYLPWSLTGFPLASFMVSS